LQRKRKQTVEEKELRDFSESKKKKKKDRGGSLFEAYQLRGPVNCSQWEDEGKSCGGGTENCQMILSGNRKTRIGKRCLGEGAEKSRKRREKRRLP